MLPDIADLRDTIVPKSDQINAEQLLAGPMTITVTAVSRGSSAEQPLVLNFEGDDGRPYKPCKSMRKVLIFAWGENGADWIGRSMTIFNKPDVKFGGVTVGGIRISHLSHIDRDIQLSLTATKGKKEPFVIKRLEIVDPVAPHMAALENAARSGMDALKKAWAAVPKDIQKKIGGCPVPLKELAEAADAQPATDNNDGVF